MKLNPMSKPPNDTRNVLFVDMHGDFFTGYANEKSLGIFNVEGEITTAWPSDFIGWIECPAIDIEETE